MIIFDVEIKRAILSHKDTPQPDVEYAKGWNDFEGMGIACVSLWDYAREQSHVYLEDNLSELQKLINQTDLVIGYNNVKFDNRVLEAHGVIVPRAKTYDLLREIWRGENVLGLLDTNGFSDAHKGYGLEAMVQANFGIGKTGNGADAPILWQRGERGRVIDYCLADVMLTRKLLDRVIRCGELRSPKNRDERIPIRRPAPEVE